MSDFVLFTPDACIFFLIELDSNAKLGGSQTWIRKTSSQTAMMNPTF
jgi:hypothetical protein